MPVEIKELYIKINVKDAQDANTSASSDEKGKEEVITECLEQVMSIMENKTER